MGAIICALGASRTSARPTLTTARSARARQKGAAEPLPKLCPECKAVLAYKARECSAGDVQIVATSMVREAEGELVELGSRKSGARGATLDEKEQFYAELKWVQATKGLRSGWCWHQYQARFNGERAPKWFELLNSTRAVYHDQQLAQEPRNRVRKKEGRVMAR